jgi:hypothetical protein
VLCSGAVLFLDRGHWSGLEDWTLIGVLLSRRSFVRRSPCHSYWPVKRMRVRASPLTPWYLTDNGAVSLNSLPRKKLSAQSRSYLRRLSWDALSIYARFADVIPQIDR